MAKNTSDMHPQNTFYKLQPAPVGFWLTNL